MDQFATGVPAGFECWPGRSLPSLTTSTSSRPLCSKLDCALIEPINAVPANKHITAIIVLLRMCP
jgi:hypothetical protein